MPRNARRMLKLDPNNNDVIMSNGNDLGEPAFIRHESIKW